MTEFTYLFRGRDTSATAEEMQKMLGKWMAWMKELSAQGHIKSPGNRLAYSGAVVSGVQKTVTDGPFAEAKDLVGGYIVIQANDLAQAAELAQGCPIFEVGGCVEVRPIQKINV